MQRASESGVAYAEAVIAMPVLVLLFLACGYVHAAYRDKLEAYADARTEAYRLRDDGNACYAGGGTPLSSLESSMAPGTAPSSADPASAENDDVSMPGAVTSLFRFARADVRRERNPEVPPILGADDGTVTVSARVVVTCNERNPPDLLDVMLGLWGTVTDAIDWNPF
jgi:hypothetical protein